MTTPHHDERELAELTQFPDMNPGPVCRLDTDGMVLRANLAAKKLFGEKDLKGKTWRTILPDMSAETWNSILMAEAPIQHEADFGNHCVLFTHVRSSSGDVIFAFGSDVTELRVAERKLSDVARFPEMNPGPVLRIDLDGDVLLANSAAHRIFGKQIIGAEWKAVCPGVDDALWQSIIRTEDPVPHEARVNECVYMFTHRCDPVSKLVFVFGTDVTHQKYAEKALRQSEKMATLGTLAAGVAHELNNPAAATKRAADHLRDAFAQFEHALVALDTASLTQEQRDRMNDLSDRARRAAMNPGNLDPISRSDLEADVESWLDEHGIDDAWELAPSLVAQGLSPDALSSLEETYHSPMLVSIIGWIAKVFPVYRLLYEISQGSSRISEIVSAMKGYSYVGQAPLRMIDIHEGLDNTLVILRSKLRQGISVKREYDTSIPKICAFGSELNQVWTNIIDNAADALDGSGEITIRSMLDGPWARVDIEDNGPGIPNDLQARIFDPFFTTKAPGKGTGLGLSTTYSIIRDKHKGEISIDSRPGRTTFIVKLLIDNPELAHDQKDERTRPVNT